MQTSRFNILCQGGRSFQRIALLAIAASLPALLHAETAEFKLHRVEDSNGSHHLAISYLLPLGWKSDDSIKWQTDPAAPMVSTIQASSPDSKFWFGSQNTRAFFYDGMGKFLKPKGVLPPDPVEYLTEMAKATDGVTDVELVDSKLTPVPSSWKTNPGATLVQSHADFVTATFRCKKQGNPSLVKLSFTLDVLDSGSPFARNNGFVRGFWRYDNLTEIGGPEAEFAKAMRIGGVSIESQKMDPQFFQQYMEIYLALSRNELQQDKAKFDAMRQAYHEISAFNKEEFQNRMDQRDKNSQRMCDYLLDRQKYTDGQSVVTLASGYTFAAKNDAGIIVETNDPSLIQDRSWHPLDKYN
jgi:hypothetical protein